MRLNSDFLISQSNRAKNYRHAELRPTRCRVCMRQQDATAVAVSASLHYNQIIGFRTKCWHNLYFICRMLLPVLMIFFIGCDYVDWGGLFAERYPVNERFADNQDLPDTVFDATIDKNNYSFLFMSDCHYYKENSHHISNAAADPRFADISFIYINGDNVQSGQQYQYDYLLEDIHSIDIPVYAGLGNHDCYNGGWALFKKHFGRSMYVLHFGDIDLFVTDTANGVIGVEQRRWLDDKLSASRAKFKIVVGHASPFDSEYVGACTMTYQDDVDFMIDLFERRNVDYCITGHLHEYDEFTVRGVHYIKLFNQAKPNHKFAKVSVVDGKLSVNVY